MTDCSDREGAEMEEDRQKILLSLQQRVHERIDLTREIPDAEILEIIDTLIVERSRESRISLGVKSELRTELFNSLRKLDMLQELVDDPSVTEIMVNGTESIFLERQGKISMWGKRFSSRQKLEDVIQQIVSKSNRMVNESSPIVDARLENGSRVNIVLYPVALNGPIVTIRRFPERPVQMADLIGWGAVSEEAAAFLGKLVEAGYNIFISGGTGSGKTTFLNALSDYIPKDSRVITIEDSCELQIKGVANLVRLEVRNANVEGRNEISIRDLIKSSLRMRPDRIIVGEVRGGEALDMLQSLNTGHDGSLSTGHANSPGDMLSRLETMVLMGMELPVTAIRRQIASGIDIIVHLGRLRDRSRRVLEITEIIGYEDGEIITKPLYSFREEGEDEDGRISGILEKRNSLYHRHKLRMAGMEQEEPGENSTFFAE
ncbi:pilus assembly protein CpaF [Anaerobium acetethylicum]|uniref:Pilus assembly protein CpaF n=2 Tax=Anaerobium acetethylicum TaxID=1619234 RepID=A0A1D3TRL4_9FIRM|nr:CpaF family protein [Anaerobium acetethylicum]SCP96369.1 pilus assembly protein CpaF [Anaerobium acetethylicum]